MTPHDGSSSPLQGDLPPQATILPLHPQHDDNVRQALHVALHAVAERADIYRLLLRDANVYGLADPVWLDGEATRDEAATAVLDALLAGGGRPTPL
jgi:hypothetical protein